jgi:hypothetical protein
MESVNVKKNTFLIICSVVCFALLDVDMQYILQV